MVSKHQIKIRMQTWEFLKGPYENYGTQMTATASGSRVGFFFHIKEENIKREIHVTVVELYKNKSELLYLSPRLEFKQSVMMIL